MVGGGANMIEADTDKLAIATGEATGHQPMLEGLTDPVFCRAHHGSADFCMDDDEQMWIALVGFPEHVRRSSPSPCTFFAKNQHKAWL